MLFYPLEKEFDFPTFAIEIGHELGGNSEMVGQKDQAVIVLGIQVSDAAQGERILLSGSGSGQVNSLIALKTDALVDGS